MKAITRLSYRITRHRIGQVIFHLLIAIGFIGGLYALSIIIVIAGVMLGIL